MMDDVDVLRETKSQCCFCWGFFFPIIHHNMLRNFVPLHLWPDLWRQTTYLPKWFNSTDLPCVKTNIQIIRKQCALKARAETLTGLAASCTNRAHQVLRESRHLTLQLNSAPVIRAFYSLLPKKLTFWLTLNSIINVSRCNRHLQNLVECYLSSTKQQLATVISVRYFSEELVETMAGLKGQWTQELNEYLCRPLSWMCKLFANKFSCVSVVICSLFPRSLNHQKRKKKKSTCLWSREDYV